jgi:opacity protein-like surface antigen
MRVIVKLGVSGVLALGATSGVQAADWTHTLTPYIWGAAMSGQAALGPVAADVDLSFSDILNNLKMGGMLSYRGENDRWAILGDAIYMNLGARKTTNTGPIQLDTTVGMQQTALEGDAGYRLTERTLLFAGLRYNDISADLSLVRSGPGAGASRAAGASQSWVDPVIGAITEIPLGERWSLGLRGDIGGFGVGSTFAWQAMATVRWQASDNIRVIGGYRYFDMDYEHGSGASLFKYGMAMSGPGLGVAFTF